MKKTNFKKLLASVSSLKFALGLGAFVASTPAVEAAPFLAGNMPQGAAIRTNGQDVTNLAYTINQRGRGNLTPNNIGNAVSEGIASTPGVPRNVVAGALNNLGLDAGTARPAIFAASESLGTDPSALVAAMFTDIFSAEGPGASDVFVSHMRQWLGNEIVDSALRQAALTPEQLANIQTAAGDDAVNQDSQIAGVY